MRPLSATEAIGPAFERTRDMFARPFRVGTFLKIAAVAFFAEMGGGLNTSSFSNGSKGLHGMPPAVLAFIVAFAIIIGLISLVIGLILFYVGSRLQLVLVELVATRQRYVSPVWRRVSAATWRWIGLKILFIICSILLALPFAIPIILFIVHHAHNLGSLSPGSLFTGMHLAQIILYVAAFIIFVIVLSAAYSLIRDFAVPSISLEDLGISAALGRVRALVAAEPGQVTLYILLRVLLAVVFGIAAEIAAALILLLSAIPIGIVGFLLWLALHNAGTVALIGLAILGGVVFLCWVFFVVIALFGVVLTFGQSYALYFLGGRYQLLGDLLDRSTPPPSYAYPTGYPPQQPPPQFGPPPVIP